MPTIAVVMPSYNHGKFIEEAILSVLNQTHTDWQLYILDNCSTDNTLEIVEPYLADARVHFIQNEENIGSLPNIVKGFSLAKEDYCVLLCADDWYESHFLEAAQQAIANAPDASYYAFGWQAHSVDEKGNIHQGRGYIPFPLDFQNKVYLSPYFVYGNFIAMTALVFKTQTVLPFLRMLENSPIRQIGEVCLMKALEEQNGPAFLNAGNFTYWRRHNEQITFFHQKNGQIAAEYLMEPILYCLGNTTNQTNKTAYWQVNRLMSMASFLIKGADMSLPVACNWLLSDIGKKWALTVDFSIEGIEKKAASVAFATALMLCMQARWGVLTRQDFVEWFGVLQKDYGLKDLKEIFALANEVYDGYFLPESLAKKIIRESEVHFPVTPQSEVLSAYYSLLAAHNIAQHEAVALDKFFQEQQRVPHFELFLVAQLEKINTLSLSLNALARLYYDDFSVRILADFDPPEELQSVKRLSWLKVKDSQNCWADLNQEILKSTVDYAIVLESGDNLLPYALPFLAERLLQKPEWKAFYVDEDAINEDGNVVNPYFKPDFSPDYFLAHDYVGDGVFFHLPSLQKLGGLDLSAPNPIYAALFLLWQQHGKKAIGHVADVLYHRFEERILKRSGNVKPWLCQKMPSFHIQEGIVPGTFEVLPESVAHEEVLWISLALDDLAFMRHFVEKTVAQFENTQFAVLVSPKLSSQVLDYLDSVDQNPPSNLAFYLIQEDQTETLMVNLLVEQSSSPLIFISRCDALWADKSGFSKLALYLNMPNVGAVAPRVLNKQGNLLGNALILGSVGTATHFGQGTHFDEKGHFARQLITQNPSALTFDAFLLRRETWTLTGGLDTSWEKLDHAACVDFSMRIQQTQQNLVWLPWISLIVLNDKPADLITDSDEVRLLENWLPQMAQDPFYNINLSRLNPFQLSNVPEVSKMRLSFKPLPRVMAFNADNMGCGHYRVIEPFYAVQKAGLIDGFLSAQHFNPFDLEVFQADTLYLQRQISDDQLRFLQNYRRYSKMRLVYELDDFITQVNVSSDHYVHIAKDLAQRLEKALSFCDRFVVTTEPLKEVYSRYIDDIRIIPNYLDNTKWGNLTPKRKQGKKPRVGWTGGISHRGDLQEIFEVVKRLANEVEWVFFGMCPEEIRDIVEWHSGVPTPEYPAYLASLNLDLAIAPLAHNAFNECKSHLKLLEYGILGYPVVASNFGPYARSQFPVTLVENTPKAWMNAIREHINDLDSAALAGNTLREWVKKDWILQNHLEEWRSAWCDF